MFNNLEPDELKKIVSNPFCCISQVDEIFIQEHEPNAHGKSMDRC